MKKVVSEEKATMVPSEFNENKVYCTKADSVIYKLTAVFVIKPHVKSGGILKIKGD